MKKTVIRLSGGLGNQMFQYALGKQLEKAGVQVQYDTSIYYRDKLRCYELDRFYTNINLVSTCMKWVYLFCYYAERKLKMQKFVRKLLGEHHEECVFGAENDLIKYKYLDGYWQNTLYFYNIKNDLRRQFVWRGTLNAKQKEIISEIENHESVMIHIRRGDYLKAINSSLYVVQDESYYNRAMKYVSVRVKDAKWFVFSDDIEWCKSLSCFSKNSIFIDKEISGSMYVDFELMRVCRHFIIANSTFSWWPSWLSPCDKKIMVAPEHWYCDNVLNKRVQNALLSEYVLL